MSFVRSHLRLGVGAWLICHVLTFTTFVVCDCCAVTEPGTAATAVAAPCHEPVPPPEPHCAHMTEDGAACPMHRSGAMPTAADRTVSALCGAPAAMLQAVLLQPAVPSAAIGVDTPHAERLRATTFRLNTRSLSIPPDAPPPRL